METPTIPPVYSIAEAAAKLKRNPHRLRGWVEGLGIELTPAGTSLLMSDADFRKLAKLDARIRKSGVQRVSRRRTTQAAGA